MNVHPVPDVSTGCLQVANWQADVAARTGTGRPADGARLKAIGSGAAVASCAEAARETGETQKGTVVCPARCHNACRATVRGLMSAEARAAPVTAVRR